MKAHAKPAEAITEQDRAYLASLVDHNSCIEIWSGTNGHSKKRRVRMRLRFHALPAKTLRWMGERWGDGRIAEGGGSGVPYYDTPYAAALLVDAYSYLIEKRDMAKSFFRFARTIGRPGEKRSREEMEERERAAEEVRSHRMRSEGYTPQSET